VAPRGPRLRTRAPRCRGTPGFPVEFPAVRVEDRPKRSEVVIIDDIGNPHTPPRYSGSRPERTLFLLSSNPGELVIEDMTHESDQSGHRWTVDTPEDLQLIREIYAELSPAGPGFGMNEILELMERRPELMKINSHIRQKEI